jgi:hypothetical protein
MTYELQVWLCRQRRIAKRHSFGIFTLGSLGYIVSIKLYILTLIIYEREEIVFLNKGRHGRHRLVVGYMTTYVICAYHD